MTARIVVVTAGLGQPSATRLLGERLATASTAALQTRDLVAEVEIVELREYAHDLTDHLLTGFPSTRLARLIADVSAADALIAVTPVFSASYSGLFKTFFDVLQPQALAGKPTLIAATAGTARHSLVLEYAMRPLFSYLRTVVVPTAVFAATEDFGGSGGALAERSARAADELAALVARSSDRSRPPTGSGTTRVSAAAVTSDFDTAVSGSGGFAFGSGEFEDVTPFAQLLSRPAPTPTSRSDGRPR